MRLLIKICSISVFLVLGFSSCAPYKDKDHHIDRIESSANSDNASKKSATIVYSDLNERIFSADYSSPIWQSGKFTGYHRRAFDRNHLDVVLEQTHHEGGFDVAIARENFADIKVSDVNDDIYVCADFSINLTGEGKWWAGAKVSVNWDYTANTETKGWYENYIIDTADRDPQEFEQFLYDDLNGTYIGSTQHDGSDYRHFFVIYNQWFQYWAVRQNYRNKGVTSLTPIFNLWRSHGMLDKKLDEIKLNVETYSKVKGDIAINGYIPLSFTDTPDMAYKKDCD